MFERFSRQTVDLREWRSLEGRVMSANVLGHTGVGHPACSLAVAPSAAWWIIGAHWPGP